MAGDLNVIERGHQPPHKVFGAWEYAFCDSFQATGLTDAFRHLHPDKTAHSWYGRPARASASTTSSSPRPTPPTFAACDYHQEAREAGRTDRPRGHDPAPGPVGLLELVKGCGCLLTAYSRTA
ncbi:hypothetical protein SUDANB178_00050 [Streptomyces sp. enrichment culture]